MITDDDNENIILNKNNSLSQSEDSSKPNSDELKPIADSDNKPTSETKDTRISKSDELEPIVDSDNKPTFETKDTLVGKSDELEPIADSNNKPTSETKDTLIGKSDELKPEIDINKNDAVKPKMSAETKTFATPAKPVKAQTKAEDTPVSLQKKQQVNENNAADMQKNLNRQQTNHENSETRKAAIAEKAIITEGIEKKSFSSSLHKEPEARNSETAYFLSAVFSRNPVFVLMLGLGPALAVTTKLTNGIGLGIIVLITMLLSNVVISALRDFIPSKIRLPFYLTIIGSIASVIIIFVKAFFPDLANSLGIFLPLTAVNSVIFGSAENFACKKRIMSTALNSVGAGVGFMLVLILISFIREFFGTLHFDFSDFGLGVYGFDEISIFGVPIYKNADFFMLPAGAFITLGILLAVKQAVHNHFNKDVED